LEIILNKSKRERKRKML